MRKKISRKIFLGLTGLFFFNGLSIASDSDLELFENSFIKQIDESRFQITTSDGKKEVVADGKNFCLQNPDKLKSLDDQKGYNIFLYQENGETFLANIKDFELEVKADIPEKTIVPKSYNTEDYNFVDEEFLPSLYKKHSLEDVMTAVSKKDFSEGYFFSDVTSVAQYGGAIYMKGNNKSKVMSIQQFGNTKPGEKVVAYYKITKDSKTNFCEWTVVAIKKKC